MSAITPHNPADGVVGSFEEARRWQVRHVVRTTTPAERLDLLEQMLRSLGDERVRQQQEARLRKQDEPPRD
jgi:hypothetical protein